MMSQQSRQARVLRGPVADEIAGVALDGRLSRRASFMVDAMSVTPELGLPQIFVDDADLEAAYRFFTNPSVTFDGLLRPHIAMTVERIEAEDVVLAVHDTTEFKFGGHARREGLGRLNRQTQGFLGHFSLAVAAEGDTRRALGVLGVETYTRPDEPKGRRRTHRRGQEDDRESKRWGRMVKTVETRVAGKTKIIHVMDREGDIYELISGALDGRHFVIRACQDRCVVVAASDGQSEHTGLLREELAKQPVRLSRTTHVSFRPENKLPGRRKSHPARRERDVTLSVSAMTVRIQRPTRGASHLAKEVVAKVVRVYEDAPPDNEPPVAWILLTSEPIETTDELNAIVEWYVRRWLIEEYMKSIKTGCSFEKRQLESYHALRNVLALTVPIAWHLLAMRSISRTEPERPAKEVFAPETLLILRVLAKRYPLPSEPTVQDAVHAIAGMGGWLKRNGPPGWLTLGRGYHRLLEAVHVVQALGGAKKTAGFLRQCSGQDARGRL